MSKIKLSEQTIAKIRQAGEKIGSLAKEKSISSSDYDKIKFTCYFLYHTKADKFLVAISDSEDGAEFSIDSGSVCPLFNTIEQAIRWWKHESFDGMGCSYMYYNRGHNMVKNRLNNINDYDLDVPVMEYIGLDQALDLSDYEEGYQQYLDDAMIEPEDSEFRNDCIVVGRQVRVELV